MLSCFTAELRAVIIAMVIISMFSWDTTRDIPWTNVILRKHIVLKAFKGSLTTQMVTHDLYLLNSPVACPGLRRQQHILFTVSVHGFAEPAGGWGRGTGLIHCAA